MNLYNTSLEAGIISSLLFDSSNVEPITDQLDTNDFFTPAHQKLYSTILELQENNKAISDDLLIRKYPELRETILDILATTPISEPAYLLELRELAEKRRLLELSELIARNISENEEPTKVEDSIRNALDDYATIATVAKSYSGHDVLAMSFADLPKYQTGIAQIDSHLDGGIEHGQLIYVTGDREAGKTHITYSIAETMAKYHKVGIVSLEFPAQKYKVRAMQLQLTQTQLANLHLNFDAENITTLERLIRKWHKDGVQFVVVDSIAVITNRGKDNERDSLTDTGKRLFRLCKNLNMTIFLIGQNSKDDHKTKNPSAYGSQMLNHFSDQMWHLLRNMDTQERTLWIHKNKQTYEYPRIPMWFKKNGEIVNYNPNIVQVVNEYQDSTTTTLEDPMRELL